MKRAKIVQKNLGKIIWYLNTFDYFWLIYSFAKIFADFYMGEFIRIFIRDIFIRPNIFGYSFVQYLWYRIYSEIHLSKDFIFVSHGNRGAVFLPRIYQCLWCLSIVDFEAILIFETIFTMVALKIMFWSCWQQRCSCWVSLGLPLTILSLAGPARIRHKVHELEVQELEVH